MSDQPLRSATMAGPQVRGSRVRASLLPGAPAAATPEAGPRPAGPRPAPGEPKRAAVPVRAICCSGGGIRAAAFTLGGLQYLSTRPDGDGTVYGKTDLVTSVSGGGWTAGSFALVGHHLDADDIPAYTPGTAEDTRLRAHTRYLVDSKTQLSMSLMGVIYGLVLNLAAIAAAVLISATGVGLLLSGHVLNVLRPDGSSSTFSAHIPDGLVAAVLIPLALGVAVYAVYRLWDVYSQRAATWATQWCVSSMVLIGLAGLAALLLIAVPELLAALEHAPARAGTASGGAKTGTVVGTVAALSAIVSQVVRTYTPTKSEKANPLVAAATKKAQPFLARIANRALPWLGSALIVAAMGVLFLTWLSVIARRPHDGQAAVVAAAFGVLLVWKLIADCNRTSLHQVYTQRLASAFGVTRAGADCDKTADRLSAYRGDRRKRPELVICAAVNTDQPGGTPSGRRCAPFTFSAHTVGISSGTMFDEGTSTRPDATFDLAARETNGPDRVRWNAEYATGIRPKEMSDHRPGLWMTTTKFEDRANGPTIMDLLAVSGAAVAPAMGRMSRPSLRLLLGVANVRLGMWLPNPLYPRRIEAPQPDERRSVSKLAKVLWRQLSQPGLTWLVKEIVGGLSLKGRWVYVTDGGHYENLGLVEALRRGATDIIVFDASGDPPFSLATFGEAVETARADLGVEITFDSQQLARDKKTKAARALAACATATYANKVQARIYLCKAAMTAGLPQDIVSWHASHPDFPNTSTVDQFYGDREFEAYRKLGWLAAEQACELREGTGVDATTTGRTHRHANQKSGAAAKAMIGHMKRAAHEQDRHIGVTSALLLAPLGVRVAAGRRRRVRAHDRADLGSSGHDDAHATYGHGPRQHRARGHTGFL